MKPFNDDSRYNSSETNREGRTSSPRKTYTSTPESGVKKKRARIGEIRSSATRTYEKVQPQSRSYSTPSRGYSEGYASSERGERSYNMSERSAGRPRSNRYDADAQPRNRYSNDGNMSNRRPATAPDGNRKPVQPKGKKKKKELPTPIKYRENIDPNTPIRLNKYLANAGVCSRREADTFIEAGVVKVNGQVVSELGTKVTRGDLVTFHGEPVRLESKVYVLLNKPKNTLTTSDDPQGRKTVMDLVKNACPERIFPVGRLDRNTTGVLLLTNDGDLASKLMHPKYDKKKVYQVRLDKDVTMEHMQAIADGIELEDGEIHADSIAYVAEDVFNEIGIEIHSGRNRLVRRIFEKLGYRVMKLDRVLFAGLTKKNLARGKWRYLNEKEVNMLRMGAFE